MAVFHAMTVDVVAYNSAPAGDLCAGSHLEKRASTVGAAGTKLGLARSPARA